MASTSPGIRVALFSPYDGMGMGHLRRNLLLLDDLVARGTASEALMISGAHEASVLPVGNGISHLTIPGLRRQDDGSYVPRSTPSDLQSLLALRSRTISAHLESFAPDLLVVDKKPLGVLGELRDHLRRIRDNGRTRIVLGLRDILEEPSEMAGEWRESRCFEALEELYDAVWIYGERRIYDLEDEIGFPPAIRRRTSYSGYLDPRRRLAAGGSGTATLLEETGVGTDPFVLCLVGGGEDGMHLAENFCGAALPTGHHGVLVSGPFMPEGFRQRLHRRAQGNPHLHVLDFLREPAGLIAAAKRVVCMGGYGTLTEVITHEKPALVVPRTRPRTEQLIRARQFANHGLVDLQHPDSLTAERLGAWIRSGTRSGEGARGKIDLGGLDRIARLVEDLRPTGPSRTGAPGAGSKPLPMENR